MEDDKNKSQTALRITFGLGVILLVFMIEIFGIHPSGIYSYSKTAYKEYQIGMSKEEILAVINQNRSIRTMRLCDPVAFFHLTSRNPFIMKPELAASDHWICYDRRGNDILLLFKDQRLERILIQQLRLGNTKRSPLFTQCDPLILKNMDLYLESQKDLKVFYKDKG